MEQEAIQKLRNIGLNNLEAEVYLLLLGEQSLTAYRIAKLLKKPSANIYKAVEVLMGKGAVIVEEGSKKLYRAIAPGEFIAMQEQAFKQKAKEAEDALANIQTKGKEEKTYSLDSVDLALEKAKRMIEAASVVVVVDAFPLALESVLIPLTEAAERGVKVFVQSYSEIEIDGVEVFVTQNYDQVLTYWESEQLNIVVDGQECLIGLFDKSLSKVFHATWSTNVYLSCILHAGRMCEQTIHKLLAVPDSKDKLAAIESILAEQEFFRNSIVPGVQSLFDRYRTKP